MIDGIYSHTVYLVCPFTWPSNIPLLLTSTLPRTGLLGIIYPASGAPNPQRLLPISTGLAGITGRDSL